MCSDDVGNLVTRRNSYPFVFFDFVRKTYFLGKRYWQMVDMYIDSVMTVQLVRKWRRESKDERTNIHHDDDDDDDDDNNNNNS